MNNFIFPVRLLLLLIVFAGFNCKKNSGTPPDNPYGLPNATQKGANTFACLINGQKFIAYYDDIYSKANLIKDTLGIQGRPKTKNYYAFIGFQISGPLFQNTSYKIDGGGSYGIYATDSTCLGISFTQTTSYAISGVIRLTNFDTLNKIVSGTFNCIFPIPNCDTLKVTDGRFDYHYY